MHSPTLHAVLGARAGTCHVHACMRALRWLAGCILSMHAGGCGIMPLAGVHVRRRTPNDGGVGTQRDGPC